MANSASAATVPRKSARLLYSFSPNSEFELAVSGEFTFGFVSKNNWPSLRVSNYRLRSARLFVLSSELDHAWPTTETGS